MKGTWYYFWIDPVIIICWYCHHDFDAKSKKLNECPNCNFNGREC